MSDPKDDETSIGSILMAMGAVTVEQLKVAVEEQKIASEDVLLGKIMVASGCISPEQLEVALSAQAGLRSKKNVKRAYAQASIAESSGAVVVGIASLVRKQSEITRKSRTGQDYPAVTDDMICKMRKP